MNFETVINQFIADTETSYDESLLTISQSEINVHQLIDNEDGSCEGIRFQINNPTEKWSFTGCFYFGNQEVKTISKIINQQWWQANVIGKYNLNQK